MAASPSTLESDWERTMEAEHLEKLSDDLSLLTKFKILGMSKWKKQDPTPVIPAIEAEFGGQTWNNNALVKIFEDNLATSPEEHIDDKTLKEAEDLLNEETIYTVPEEKVGTKSRLDKLEDENYLLKKRLNRIEGREGTVFLSLHSITEKINKIMGLIEPEHLNKWVQEMDDYLLGRQLQDFKYMQEVMTYRKIAKKNMERVKELEHQLHLCNLTVESAMEEREDIIDVLESRTAELEERKAELRNIMISIDRDSYKVDDN